MANPMNKPIPITPATLDDVLDEMRLLRGSVDICVEQGNSTAKELGQLRQDVEDLKVSRRTHSDAVRQATEVTRQTSSNDMKQDAAIAELHEKSDRVEKKVDELTNIAGDIRSAAKTLINSPKVKVAVGIVWTALLGWAASKGWLH